MIPIVVERENLLEFLAAIQKSQVHWVVVVEMMDPDSFVITEYPEDLSQIVDQKIWRYF